MWHFACLDTTYKEQLYTKKLSQAQMMWSQKQRLKTALLSIQTPKYLVIFMWNLRIYKYQTKCLGTTSRASTIPLASHEQFIDQKCFIHINSINKGKLSLWKKLIYLIKYHLVLQKHFQTSRYFEYNAFCEHERVLNCWSLFPGLRICFGCFSFPRRHHVRLLEFLDGLTIVSALTFTGEMHLHHLNQIVIFHWIY